MSESPPSEISSSPPPSPSEDYSGRGSLQADLKEGQYTLQWPSWEVFKLWLKEFKEESVVEFIYHKTQEGRTNIQGAYEARKTYRCGRRAKSSQYDKKLPDRKQNVPSKRTGCKCTLVVKTYHGISQVLGCFINEHSHELGQANLITTNLSADDRKRITEMVHSGKGVDIIVCI